MADPTNVGGYFREVGTTTGTTENFTVNPDPGDIMWLGIITEDSTTVTATATGYTLVETVVDTSGGDMRFFRFKRVADGSETSFTFSLSANVYTSVGLHVVRGGDEDPYATASLQRDSGGSTNTPRMPGFTTTHANTLAIGWLVGYETGPLTALTGWSEPTGSTAFNFYRSVATASTIGATSATGSATRWIGHVILLADTGGGGAAQDLTGAHIASTATLAAPTVTPGPVAVAPPAITSGAQMFAPSVTTGAVTVSPPVIASTAVLFAPSLGVLVSPPAIASSAALFAPTVTRGAVSLGPPAIASTATLATPTVTRGAVSVSPPAIASSAVMSAPTVTSGAVSVAPPAIASTATLAAPTVMTGPVTITGAHLASGAVISPPTVTQGGTIVPPVIPSGATLSAPTVTPGPASVAAPAIASTATLTAPTVTPGAVTVTLPAIASTATTSPPTVTLGGTSVSPPHIPSTATLAAPTVTPGPVAVVLPFIPSGSVLYPPAVFIGALVQPGTSSSTIRGGGASSVLLPGLSQPAFLTSDVGYVSTPDSADLRIVGDVRITAKVRLVRGTISGVTFPIIVGQTGQFSMLYRTAPGGGVQTHFRIDENATTGVATSRVLTANTGDQVDSIMFPDGDDAFVGAEIKNDTVTRMRGIRSDDADGPWEIIGTGYDAASVLVWPDAATSLLVGNGWRGRIYWVQMETLDASGNPDELIWRFDADEYPGTGTTYVDPRGRSWTLATGATITPAVIARESAVTSMVLP